MTPLSTCIARSILWLENVLAALPEDVLIVDS